MPVAAAAVAVGSCCCCCCCCCCENDETGKNDNWWRMQHARLVKGPSKAVRRLYFELVQLKMSVQKRVLSNYLSLTKRYWRTDFWMRVPSGNLAQKSLAVRPWREWQACLTGGWRFRSNGHHGKDTLAQSANVNPRIFPPPYAPRTCAAAQVFALRAQVILFWIKSDGLRIIGRAQVFITSWELRPTLGICICARYASGSWYCPCRPYRVWKKSRQLHNTSFQLSLCLT